MRQQLHNKGRTMLERHGFNELPWGHPKRDEQRPRSDIGEADTTDETSVLGPLGTIGTIHIIPEDINKQFPRSEEGEA